MCNLHVRFLFGFRVYVNDAVSENRGWLGGYLQLINHIPVHHCSEGSLKLEAVVSAGPSMSKLWEMWPQTCSLEVPRDKHCILAVDLELL